MKPKHEIPWRRHKEVAKKNRAESEKLIGMTQDNLEVALRTWERVCYERDHRKWPLITSSPI